jgi:hypothetical protein
MYIVKVIAEDLSRPYMSEQGGTVPDLNSGRGDDDEEGLERPDPYATSILQLALMGLDEPGGRIDPGLEEPGERIARAPDLVVVTCLEQLLGVEEPGVRRDPAADLVLVAQLELLLKIGRRSRAPYYVPVSCLELLLGVEEPGGRRAAAPDLELRQVVTTITGGKRAAAPVLVLVTHHELWQGIVTIPLGPSAQWGK